MDGIAGIFWLAAAVIAVGTVGFVLIFGGS